MAYTVQGATGLADTVAGTTHTLAYAMVNGTGGTNRVLKLVVIGDNRNDPSCTYNGVAGTRKDNDQGGSSGYKSCSTFVWNDADLPADTSSYNFVITWADGSCTDAVCLVLETSDETQDVATYNLVSTLDGADPHEVTITPANALALKSHVYVVAAAGFGPVGVWIRRLLMPPTATSVVYDTLPGSELIVRFSTMK